LKLAEFTLDEGTSLYIAPGVGIPAGYLDGAEQYLVEGLQRISDRSIGSAELAAIVRDWPTEYHLSPFRTTIFDCLGVTDESLRVLELGCGCGAITRWLGERCGEVHAIEGNAARALAARTRCADLTGVQVYVGNFSELDEREGFDVVTLIGVLEYGHLYHPVERNRPAAAAAAGLRQARDALRSDGVLVLAIENQLGIKYLNGAREDHSAVRRDRGIPRPVAQRRDVQRA
jgi:SAM-dependent methyltransferase